MPQVTLTLTDMPLGGVDIQTDFKPTVGAPCSAAQAAALDIVARTRKAYGLDVIGVARARIEALPPMQERGR